MICLLNFVIYCDIVKWIKIINRYRNEIYEEKKILCMCECMYDWWINCIEKCSMCISIYILNFIFKFFV